MSCTAPTLAPIAVAAGGTGGHIFPALAVARVLHARGHPVLWLGNAVGMEGPLVAASPFAFADLAFGQVRGKGWRRWAQLPPSLAAATLRARRALQQAGVAIVATFGGYVSVPAALAAKSLRLPLTIHEQNARPGLANRLLAPLADQVLTGFPEVLPRAVWVGNPVRPEFLAFPPPGERYHNRSGPLRLLVLGGSLGAQRLNALVPAALRLVPEPLRPVVVHQTGRGHEQTTEAAYREAGVVATCCPFLDPVAPALAEADWVICRAGAMTVAEVAALGVAAHFVPYPYAVDDHQFANAQWLAGQGAAVVRREAELTPEILAAWWQEQGASRTRAQKLGERAYALGKRAATEEVAALIEELGR